MAKKWLRYGQKTYAEIWAFMPYLGHNLVEYQLYLNYTFSVTNTLIHLKLPHLRQKMPYISFTRDNKFSGKILEFSRQIFRETKIKITI